MLLAGCCERHSGRKRKGQREGQWPQNVKFSGVEREAGLGTRRHFTVGAVAVLVALGGCGSPWVPLSPRAGLRCSACGLVSEGLGLPKPQSGEKRGKERGCSRAEGTVGPRSSDPGKLRAQPGAGSRHRTGQGTATATPPRPHQAEPSHTGQYLGRSDSAAFRYLSRRSTGPLRTRNASLTC